MEQIRAGMGQIAESVLRLRPMSRPLIYFRQAAVWAFWEIRVWVKDL